MAFAGPVRPTTRKSGATRRLAQAPGLPDQRGFALFRRTARSTSNWSASAREGFLRDDARWRLRHRNAYGKAVVVEDRIELGAASSRVAPRAMRVAACSMAMRKAYRTSSARCAISAADRHQQGRPRRVRKIVAFGLCAGWYWPVRAAASRSPGKTVDVAAIRCRSRMSFQGDSVRALTLMTPPGSRTHGQIRTRAASHQSQMVPERFRQIDGDARFDRTADSEPIAWL